MVSLSGFPGKDSESRCCLQRVYWGHSWKIQLFGKGRCREMLNHVGAATEVSEYPIGIGQSLELDNLPELFPIGAGDVGLCSSTNSWCTPTIHLLWAAPWQDPATKGCASLSCQQWIFQQPRDGCVNPEERICDVVMRPITHTSRHWVDYSHTLYQKLWWENRQVSAFAQVRFNLTWFNGLWYLESL